MNTGSRRSSGCIRAEPVWTTYDPNRRSRPDTRMSRSLRGARLNASMHRESVFGDKTVSNLRVKWILGRY